MSKLERVYLTLMRLDRSRGEHFAAPAMLILTLVYLVAVLSVSIYEPQKLIWLAAYPIIASEITGIGYWDIIKKSLWILPLLALIAIFNPIIDRTDAFHVGSFIISRGWVSFFSILLRGLLALQGVLLMVKITGFIDIFNMMRKLGLPKVLCSQLLLTYRYISVIVEEALIMRRARESRGFGRRSYPLKMWGRFVGQLLIRSSRRAVRIHQAMDARGFNGTLPVGCNENWSSRTWFWLISWIIIITLLRFINFSLIIKNILR